MQTGPPLVTPFSGGAFPDWKNFQWPILETGDTLSERNPCVFLDLRSSSLRSCSTGHRSQDLWTLRFSARNRPLKANAALQCEPN